MNAMQHPALAATVPMSSGAGIGQVGPYNEQGNFYRGGAVQTGSFWFWWYYGSGYTYSPRSRANLRARQLIRISTILEHGPEYDPAVRASTPRSGPCPLNKIMERHRGDAERSGRLREPAA